MRPGGDVFVTDERLVEHVMGQWQDPGRSVCRLTYWSLPASSLSTDRGRDPSGGAATGRRLRRPAHRRPAACRSPHLVTDRARGLPLRPRACDLCPRKQRSHCPLPPGRPCVLAAASLSGTCPARRQVRDGYDAPGQCHGHAAISHRPDLP